MNDINFINKRAPIRNIFGLDLDMKYEEDSDKSENSRTEPKTVNTSPAEVSPLKKEEEIDPLDIPEDTPEMADMDLDELIAKAMIEADDRDRRYDPNRKVKFHEGH